MAQLDIATYLPQVFWLLCVFVCFYFVVIKRIIPTMSTILKVRAKKLSQGQEVLVEMGKESDRITVGYEDQMKKTLKESGEILNKVARDTGNWIVGNTQEKEINSLYLAKVGDLIGKKRLLLNSSLSEKAVSKSEEKVSKKAPSAAKRKKK